MSTERKVFRYENLAKEIESKIMTGTYHPGERLPSIRKLHHQYLISKLLASGAYERQMTSLRNTLKKQMVRTAFTIRKHFPPDTRLMLPEGGSLLWVQLPSGIDGLKVHQRALEHNIAIIPGVVCSNTGQFTNDIQISYASPFTSATERGMATLGKIIHEFCDSTPTPRASCAGDSKP